MVQIIVNSTLGKSSNIGFRAGHIVQELNTTNVPYQVWCRDSQFSRSSRVHTVYPFGELIPRALRFLSIYVSKTVHTRILDNALFEMLLRRSFIPQENELVHLWDPLLRTMQEITKRNGRVLLEVPIAPSRYGRELIEAGLYPHPLSSDRRFEELEEEAYARANALLSPSSFVTDQLTRLGVPQGKIHTIPFGAPQIVSRLATSPREDEKIRFVFAGTGNYRKGVHHLLDAWSLVADLHHRAELHLCGHVIPELRLRAQTIPSVITPGFVSSLDYLASCHVYVFPSLMEGSAKSIYEAMRVGLPIITTPAAGSIVTDTREGYIVPLGDCEKIAEKIRFFITHPEERERMGARALKTVLEYTWERYAREVGTLYKTLALL